MVCFKCLKDLPFDDFYRHPGMKSGRLGKCKECAKTDVRANYRKRKVQYAKYEKMRNQNEIRRKSKTIIQRKRRAISPEKYKARMAVGNALRDGRLFRQPCERCGDRKSQAHHHDYSKPLDVHWLCFACHCKEHGREAILSSIVQEV